MDAPGREPSVSRERVPRANARCEHCGARAGTRVIRWAARVTNEPARKRQPQQTHWYCDAHQARADQMEALLWSTAA